MEKKSGLVQISIINDIVVEKVMKINTSLQLGIYRLKGRNT
jgi:hypothetical protein